MWLDVRNIKTRRPSVKLNHCHLGPYKVVESIGTSAIRLRLSATVQIHPVFRVSLLEHAADNPFPGQVAPPPPAVIVDGEKEWEVETIFDSRLHYNRFQYLVKWKGYDAPTWQPATDLEHSSGLIREFHQLWPDRTRPIALARARDIGGGYCHGLTPMEETTIPDVGRTPYLVVAVTSEQRSTYGVGAGIFERMWSGQGCRHSSDRRGIGS